jgi:hypothetical protein
LEEARAVAADILARTRLEPLPPEYGLLLDAAEDRFGAKVDWVDRV